MVESLLNLCFQLGIADELWDNFQPCAQNRRWASNEDPIAAKEDTSASIYLRSQYFLCKWISRYPKYTRNKNESGPFFCLDCVSQDRVKVWKNDNWAPIPPAILGGLHIYFNWDKARGHLSYPIVKHSLKVSINNIWINFCSSGWATFHGVVDRPEA